MGDSSTKPIGGTFEDVGEEVKDAMVEPIKDAVGEAIEAGVQAVVGATQTPQQMQQRKIEEQKQLIEARRKIAFWTDISNKQQQVRVDEKNKLDQKKQEEQQETQQKKQQKSFAESKKAAEVNPALAAATNKSETRKGVGG